MLINSAQKMSSIQGRISEEFIDPVHQLSANILGSYMWRYVYLPSVHFCLYVKITISFSVSLPREIVLLYMFLFQRHSSIHATHVGSYAV